MIVVVLQRPLSLRITKMEIEEEEEEEEGGGGEEGIIMQEKQRIETTAETNIFFHDV